MPRGWWHLGTTVPAEGVGAPCPSPTLLPVVSSFPPAQGQVLRDELTTRGAARFSELRSHSSKLTKPEAGSGEPLGHSQRSAAQVAVWTRRWHLRWGQPCGSGAVSGYSVRVELNCRTVCCLESCLLGWGSPTPDTHALELASEPVYKPRKTDVMAQVTVTGHQSMGDLNNRNYRSCFWRLEVCGQGARAHVGLWGRPGWLAKGPCPAVSSDGGGACPRVKEQGGLSPQLLLRPQSHRIGVPSF